MACCSDTQDWDDSSMKHQECQATRSELSLLWSQICTAIICSEALLHMS